MVIAPKKVWDDLILSNKKFGWYRIYQLLHTNALDTYFNGRQATSDGAKSIHSVITIRSVEEDDKEDEDEIETQLDTQILESQSPFIEEDGIPQPQDLEAGRAVVQKCKPTIS